MVDYQRNQYKYFFITKIIKNLYHNISNMNLSYTLSFDRYLIITPSIYRERVYKLNQWRLKALGGLKRIKNEAFFKLIK